MGWERPLHPTRPHCQIQLGDGMNIRVCGLMEGTLGGRTDGRTGGGEEREREKPPAAGLANSLASDWRCSGERGWKSAAPDSHVISSSLPAPVRRGLPRRTRVCASETCCDNGGGGVDFPEPTMRRATYCTSLLSELGPRKLTEAAVEECSPQNVAVSIFHIGKHLSGSRFICCSDGNALELMATLTFYASASL